MNCHCPNCPQATQSEDSPAFEHDELICQQYVNRVYRARRECAGYDVTFHVQSGFSSYEQVYEFLVEKELDMNYGPFPTDVDHEQKMMMRTCSEISSDEHCSGFVRVTFSPTCFCHPDATQNQQCITGSKTWTVEYQDKHPCRNDHVRKYFMTEKRLRAAEAFFQRANPCYESDWDEFFRIDEVHRGVSEPLFKNKYIEVIEKRMRLFTLGRRAFKSDVMNALCPMK